MSTNMQDKVCKQQDQVMRIPPESFKQINIHAFFLPTEFLKVLKKMDFKKMEEDSV